MTGKNKEEEKQKIIAALEKVVIAGNDINKLMNEHPNRSMLKDFDLNVKGEKLGDYIVHYKNTITGIYNGYQFNITKLENKK
jgi:hypothetical protein